MSHSAADRERRREQRRRNGLPLWARILPGAYVLRHYDRKWLRGTSSPG